jgi:hypothetical protein
MGKSNTRESLEVEGILLVAALVVFLGTDPFNILMGAGVRDFQAKYVALPLCRYLVEFPSWQAKQASEMKWQPGEFHAPESVPFDLQGSGPYTSVSDGCVL